MIETYTKTLTVRTHSREITYFDCPHCGMQLRAETTECSMCGAWYSVDFDGCVQQQAPPIGGAAEWE